ncbi:hypothetical protein LWI29_017234 [Acer saccharum]|uniref:Uncharacterized protein n=1 Tax=Acer saccharum TaxID=4024 RepID=A0AA39W5P6_ACESA|nr:hypothetical protein LWI29_017234 [Acer saccharum]
MTSGSLKVPKKVNLTIMKKFRDLELSFLNPAPGGKSVKREPLVSSVSGRVDSIAGSSNLIPPKGVPPKVIQSSTLTRKRKSGKDVTSESVNPRLKIAMEKLAHVFSDEQYKKDVQIGTDRLLEQVVTSNENFTRCLLLKEGFAFQVASFGDERNKMKINMSKL